MKTPDLLDAKQKRSLLNSLGSKQIRRFFSKNIPHIEALEKAPPFSKFTARKQKEKAAIAAW